MKIFPVLTLSLALTAPSMWAKDKHPNADFQDATLVSFREVATGSSCSHVSSTTGKMEASTDESGQTSGSIDSTTSGDTSCRDTGWIYYTLQVGDHTFVVHHAVAPFFRSSDLKGLIPGTHVLVRTDSKGLYIRVGDKESKFVVVEGK